MTFGVALVALLCGVTWPYLFFLWAARRTTESVQRFVNWDGE